MTIIHLGFGIPAYGGKVAAEHARMWLELGHTLASSEERFNVRMPVMLVDVCQVDKARNMIVEAAFQSHCDWLLMIDADVWIEDPWTLLRMISEADKAGHEVAVAPVQRRRLSDQRGQLGEGHGRLSMGRVRQATACMAMRLGALPRPWFQFLPNRSEDLNFCDRIRERHGTIVADRRVQTCHSNRPEILRHR